MKKNIIAMAVAAAVAAPAAAMADTTLYGKIHASYDVFGGDQVDDNDYSFASNSSRLGIKGKEAISDNLAFIYQWETTIEWGDNGNIGGGRNTFVGFDGGFGTVIAGRHDTPFKKVGRKYDLFGDTVGDSRAIIRGRAFDNAASYDTGEVDVDGDPIEVGNQLGNDWDLRTSNTVAYATPDMGGFSAMAAYVSDWQDEYNNNYDAYSLSAGYEIAGFTIDAAYEVHNAEGDFSGSVVNDVGDTVNYNFDRADDQTAMRVGAGYKMGGFKIVGLYQQMENVDYIDGADVDMWGLGGAYSFGKSTIKAQYYMADDVDDTNDTDADLWAIGYDYKLSKQTSVYAAYASMAQGDGISSYAVGKGTGHGHAGKPDADGADTNAFSVGLVHKF